MFIEKSYMPINLQLFGKKKKDKLEDLSAEELRELNEELENDSDDDDFYDDDEYADDDVEDYDDDDDQDVAGDDDEDDDIEDIEEDEDAADDENEVDYDDEESDEEEDEEDSDEDVDDDAAAGKGKKDTGQKKDKKTSAIIALKKELNRLRAQYETLAKSQRDREYETEEDRLAARYEAELIEDGMDEEKAKKRARMMAKEKIEAMRALDRDLEIQVERLEEKGYTDIRSKLSILKPIIEKAGLTLEEAYRAKYGEPKGKAAKTREEQLRLLEKKKVSKKAAATAGTTKAPEKITFSKRDERIFKEMRKMDPTLTRKKFASLMADFED
ncbi:MAG TPA: hypothetical protein PLP87_09045 [Clostridiales bacterium]|nr:hypothetical protein [Clostridiales bacterium]